MNTLSPTALLVIKTTATSEGVSDARIARALAELQGEAIAADQHPARLLSMDQYATHWGVTVRTVQRWISDGEIDVIKRGRLVRILESELLKTGNARQGGKEK